MHACIPSVSMKRINLANLRIRPRINLSPETKQVFTWKEMRAPLSVTLAAILAMVSSLLYEYYFREAKIRIMAAAVISTTLLIMGEMGTSEKFYLRTTLRVVGVIAGLILGMIYAVCEEQLEKYLGIDHSEEVAKGAPPRYNSNDWIIILFRLFLISPTIFVCCLFMKIFPKYSYAINVMAIHCPVALLARTFLASLGITFAALLAVLVSVISIFLLDKFTTESLLMDTNRTCITGVLSVFQLAVTGDPEERDQFLKHTDSVHKSISSAESSIDVYTQWRKWTCRNVVHDFKALVKPTRPLFYQAYSLFWSNVAAYHAIDYRADILFCNDSELYEKHFKSLVDELVISIDRVKESLTKLFKNPNMIEAEMDSVFDEILVSHLWNGIVRAQEDMKVLYLKLRKSVFSTFGQRWNMTDYLRQMALMTLALVDYLRAMVAVFQKSERQLRLNKVLEQVADSLDRLRKDDETGHSSYTSRFSAIGNPSLRASITDFDGLALEVAKSTSSPDLLSTRNTKAVPTGRNTPPSTHNDDENSVETTSLLKRPTFPGNQ